EAHGARIVDVRDPVRKADFAEQRRASVDRSGVQDVRTATRDLVDAATNLLVAGARERSARQGHHTTDGTREGRYDAQRVHASDRRFTSSSRRHSWLRIDVITTSASRRPA